MSNIPHLFRPGPTEAEVTTPSPRRRRRSRTARGWAAPHALGQTGRNAALRLGGDLALLGLVTAADFVVIKSSLDLALQQEPALSWLMAVGLSVAAVVVMLRAGVSARGADADGRPRRGATVLVIAWAGFGGMLFYLRWSAANLIVGSPQFQGGPSGQTAGQSGTPAEHVVAVAMAGAYLVTGLLALGDGYKMTNPVLPALRAAERSLDAAQASAATAEGRVARLIGHLSLHRHQAAIIEVEHDRAIEVCWAFGEHLKQHARAQIALCLGNPAATGVVRDTPEPASPQPREQGYDSQGPDGQGGGS